MTFGGERHLAAELQPTNPFPSTKCQWNSSRESSIVFDTILKCHWLCLSAFRSFRIPLAVSHRANETINHSGPHVIFRARSLIGSNGKPFVSYKMSSWVLGMADLVGLIVCETLESSRNRTLACEGPSATETLDPSKPLQRPPSKMKNAQTPTNLSERKIEGGVHQPVIFRL